METVLSTLKLCTNLSSSIIKVNQVWIDVMKCGMFKQLFVDVLSLDVNYKNPVWLGCQYWFTLRKSGGVFGGWNLKKNTKYFKDLKHFSFNRAFLWQVGDIGKGKEREKRNPDLKIFSNFQFFFLFRFLEPL